MLEVLCRLGDNRLEVRERYRGKDLSKHHFPGGSVVKNSPAKQETHVQSLGREDPLEEGMAAHSSVLAWRIPWTEEPGGYSPGGRKESDTTEHDTVHIKKTPN